MTRNDYVLRIIVSGNCFDVVGPEGELRAVLMDWYEYGDESVDGKGRILVRGHSDDSRKIPVTHALRRDAISGMYLSIV